MNSGHSTSALSPLQRVALQGLGLAVSLGIVWLTYAVAIRPSVERRGELVAEQYRLEMLHQSHERVLLAHRDVDTNLNASIRSVDLLLNQVGHPRHANKTLQTLSECANRTNTTIISLNPSPPRQAEYSMIQTAKLSLRCDYSSLCEFLSSLHSSGSPIWVVEIDINCGKGDAGLPGYGVRRAELTVHLLHSIHPELLEQIPHPLNVAKNDKAKGPEA